MTDDHPGQYVVPALLTTNATAKVLSVSDRTVRRRIAEGDLPAVLEHGRLMVRGDELRTYIENLDRYGNPARARPRRRARRYDINFLAE